MRTRSSKQRFPLLAIAAGFAALTAMSAQAQQAQNFYLGGNLGRSELRDEDTPGVDTSATGYKLYGGYRFHSNFAVETGWMQTGKFEGLGLSLRGYGVFADLVGTLPVARDFSLLARLGVVHGKLKASGFGGSVSESDTNIKGGLGVQYDLSKNSAIRGEWERYRLDAFGSTAKTDFWSIGYKYQF